MALLIEVAGFVLLAAAALLWHLVAGLAICGAELLLLGFLVDYTGVEPKFPRPRLPRRAKREAK